MKENQMLKRRQQQVETKLRFPQKRRLSDAQVKNDKISGEKEIELTLEGVQKIWRNQGMIDYPIVIKGKHYTGIASNLEQSE